MTPAHELPGVVDNPDASRLEVSVDGRTADLTYRRSPGRLVIVHTEVPDALSGRGIGGALIRAAVDRAADAKLTLVPACPFAASWLQDHPDEAQRVTIDWPDQ